MPGNALSSVKMQRFVVQELPSGTCAKLLLRNGGFFFSLNFGITIGNQAQSGAEADTVMPYMSLAA
jgi:hypothetical protein